MFILVMLSVTAMNNNLVIFMKVLCWHVWGWCQRLWGVESRSCRNIVVRSGSVSRVAFHLERAEHHMRAKCYQVILNSTITRYFASERQIGYFVIIIFQNFDFGQFNLYRSMHLWPLETFCWILISGRVVQPLWHLLAFSNTWLVTAWRNSYLCVYCIGWVKCYDNFAFSFYIYCKNNIDQW